MPFGLPKVLTVAHVALSCDVISCALGSRQPSCKGFDSSEPTLHVSKFALPPVPAGCAQLHVMSKSSGLAMGTYSDFGMLCCIGSPLVYGKIVAICGVLETGP